MGQADQVDVVLEQWAVARPDLDVSAMGVLGRLSRVTRITEKRLQEVFSQYDLQRGEFDILATLRRAGGPSGMTAGALAASAMVTSGAITNRVDRLVAKGLVSRDIDPANRRSTQIALTTRGREMVDLAVADHVANEEQILAALTGRQRAQLADLLRVLLTGLGDSPVE